MPNIIAAFFLIFISQTLLAETEQHYDQISFNEEASEQVENNLLVAVLFIQKEGSDTEELTNEVNHQIRIAVNIAKNIQDIKVQTLNYRTHAKYHKNKISGWSVTQSIRLESKNSKKLGQLIAQLQRTLKIQSIGYQISDDKRRHHSEALMQTALKRFQSRAQLITETLGYRHFKIVNINITNDGQAMVSHNRGMMRSMAMADSSPVQLEAGRQKLQVSVQGRIELK